MNNILIHLLILVFNFSVQAAGPPHVPTQEEAGPEDDVHPPCNEVPLVDFQTR